MKTLWNIVAVLSLANLLAIAALIGWLGWSGRVTRDRIETIQGLFAEPSDVVAAQLAAEQVAREEEALRAVDEASLLHLPAGSDVPISALDDLWRREQMMMQRIERENAALQQDLAQHEAALAAREKAHDQRVSKFEQEKAIALAEQSDVAFLTLVKTMESLPAKLARDQMVLMAKDSSLEEACRILRAMRAGSRTELLASMRSTDEEKKLASDLLQCLGAPPVSQDARVETNLGQPSQHSTGTGVAASGAETLAAGKP